MEIDYNKKINEFRKKMERYEFILNSYTEEQEKIVEMGEDTGCFEAIKVKNTDRIEFNVPYLLSIYEEQNNIRGLTSLFGNRLKELEKC